VKWLKWAALALGAWLLYRLLSSSLAKPKDAIDVLVDQAKANLDAAGKAS
jgi:hypothetical protein